MNGGSKLENSVRAAACRPLGPEFPELSRSLAGAHLVGVGEVPHHVADYYEELLALLKRVSSGGGKTLLLLERPFWLDELFDRWLAGADGDLLRVFGASETPLCGAAGIRFFEGIKNLNAARTDAVVCRCLDFSAKDPAPRFAGFNVKSPVRGIMDASAALAALLRDGLQDDFSSAREDFLFGRASEAVAAARPDRVVLFSGSFHAGRYGGRPFGKEFHEPLFSRLCGFLKRKSLNLSFFPLSGGYGQLKSTDGGISIEEKDSSDLFKAGFKSELRSVLRGIKGEKLLIPTGGLEYDGENRAEFIEFVKNHDFVLSFGKICPDIR